MSQAVQLLSESSLAAFSSFLESNRHLRYLIPKHVNSLLTFDQLHNLYLGVSNEVKTYFMNYVSCRSLLAGPGKLMCSSKHSFSQKRQCCVHSIFYLLVLKESYP